MCTLVIRTLCYKQSYRMVGVMVYLLQGYKQRKAYIATQGPLSGTVADLWRMIWEHHCSCIVMLCQTQEKGKVSDNGGFERATQIWICFPRDNASTLTFFSSPLLF